MTFDEPLPWTEALDRLDGLGLLPTHLSSAELREEWGADLRARSLFSARTTKADVLEGYRGQLREMLDGKTNIATARAKIQDMLDGLGYDPERGGFEGEEVEPAERGTLRDLASNERIDLVLRTNVAQVAGFAETQRAMGSEELYWFPAWELIRVATVTTPRGKRRTKEGLVDDPGKDWPSRWEKAGGDFYDGHMIALKDDPIWQRLGDSALFADALDTSYPPWAFNSGYGRREVPRRECLLLGLVSTGARPAPAPVKMNEGLTTTADRPAAELAALTKDLDTAIDGLKVRLKAKGYDLATRRQP